jgi:heat shock protein HslJ
LGKQRLKLKLNTQKLVLCSAQDKFLCDQISNTFKQVTSSIPQPYLQPGTKTMLRPSSMRRSVPFIFATGIATLLLTLPTQAAPADSTELVNRARGNEPFWSLEIGATTTTFQTPEGPAISVPTPVVEAIAQGQRYTSPSLTATILDQPCIDSMSGMPFPTTAQVVVGGQTYQGCGGDPITLLQGGEWQLVAINDKSLVPDSHPTLNFGANGQLSGQAFCNNYAGPYTLTGEGLSIKNLASTRRGCLPPLMDREGEFFSLLEQVQRFEIATDGSLILHTVDGQRLKAQRECHETSTR